MGRPFQVPPNRITKTLKGQFAITGGTAAAEAFSGTRSHSWVKLQALYELRSAERNTGNAIKTPPTLAVHGRKLYDAQPWPGWNKTAVQCRRHDLDFSVKNKLADSMNKAAVALDQENKSQETPVHDVELLIDEFPAEDTAMFLILLATMWLSRIFY